MSIFTPLVIFLTLNFLMLRSIFPLLEDFTNILAIMQIAMQLSKIWHIVLSHYVSFFLSKLKAFSYQLSSTQSLRLITMLALLILMFIKIQVLLVSVIGTLVDCHVLKKSFPCVNDFDIP